MKTKLTLFTLSLLSVFAPIALCAIILMFMIFIDTFVKLISIKKIACAQKKRFRDVFKSKILRKGYIFKAAGYYIIAGAMFPLDYYVLTPFTTGVIHAIGFTFIIANTAIYTNILLGIFCLMEFSSINENWFDITGSNILKSVSLMVKKIRVGVENISDTYKNIKM